MPILCEICVCGPLRSDDVDNFKDEQTQHKKYHFTMTDTRIVEAVDRKDLPSLKLLVEEDGAGLDAFDGEVCSLQRRFACRSLTPPR